MTAEIKRIDLNQGWAPFCYPTQSGQLWIHTTQTTKLGIFYVFVKTYTVCVYVCVFNNISQKKEALNLSRYMGGFGERNRKGYIILYKVIIIYGESYVMLFQLQLY